MEYTVQALAELSGVTPRTLRWYDRIGLLKPGRVGENGYRYYGPAQVDRLQDILYYRALGVPLEQIPELAEHSAVCVPTMMPYITAFFMPRAKGDRPAVIPDGCVNFAFLGQFADTPRDTVFTTEYSVRTAMEAVYGLLGVDRGVPEVWGSVYDIRELLRSSVCLMDGKSPLEISLPGPLELLKKPLLKAIRGTVIEKVLKDQGIL